MLKRKIILLSWFAIFSLSSCYTYALPQQQQKSEIYAKAATLSKKTQINPKVLSLALNAHSKADRSGVRNKDILTVIDYSLPSTKKRLWVLDLKKERVLHHTLVAHGKNSGELYAKHFSNKNGSRTSSLGLFVTKNTYYGSNGYSLRLSGLDRGFNDQAYRRAIVMHGANYVSESIARKYGRIGRSWACPSVPAHLAKPVINSIRGGTHVFVYGNDRRWLSASKYLRA